MTPATALRIAALLGALAVALGAFGAHGLKDVLAQRGVTALWETAVFYHFIHAVMLTVLSLHPPIRHGPWWCFLVGIVLFSGSLYALALTGTRGLGAITPLGGVSFIAGWVWLALGGGRSANGAAR
jgi:uncharacterized membrane protein YgdD (TMEM256/DUF423 family)